LCLPASAPVISFVFHVKESEHKLKEEKEEGEEEEPIWFFPR
jgi:hypothetical protein